MFAQLCQCMVSDVLIMIPRPKSMGSQISSRVVIPMIPRPMWSQTKDIATMANVQVLRALELSLEDEPRGWISLRESNSGEVVYRDLDEDGHPPRKL